MAPKTKACCSECKAELRCPSCNAALFPATYEDQTFGYLCPRCMEKHAFEAEERQPNGQHTDMRN